MRFRKVIRRRLRHETGGVQAAGDVHVAIAANVGRTGGHTSVASVEGGDTPEQRDPPTPAAASPQADDDRVGPSSPNPEGGSTDGR